MTAVATKSLCAESARVDRILSRLDSDSGKAMQSLTLPKNRRTGRAHERIEYRQTNVQVRIEHPGGGETVYRVCTRNISAGGVSFLHSNFLHPHSKCWVTLPMCGGSLQAIAGTLVSCRLVEGRVHEIGMRFAEKIDPTQFINPKPPQETQEAGLSFMARKREFLGRLASLRRDLISALSPPNLILAQSICLDLKRSGAELNMNVIASAAESALDMLDGTASIAKSFPQLERLIKVLAT